MTENRGIQRLFGGCGCGFEICEFLPIIIIGAILLLGDEILEFIRCNEEIALIFIVILLLLVCV